LRSIGCEITSISSAAAKEISAPSDRVQADRDREHGAQPGRREVGIAEETVDAHPRSDQLRIEPEPPERIEVQCLEEDDARVERAEQREPAQRGSAVPVQLQKSEEEQRRGAIEQQGRGCRGIAAQPGDGGDTEPEEREQHRGAQRKPSLGAGRRASSSGRECEQR
jgi:hypothetical protein